MAINFDEAAAWLAANLDLVDSRRHKFINDMAACHWSPSDTSRWISCSTSTTRPRPVRPTRRADPDPAPRTMRSDHPENTK